MRVFVCVCLGFKCCWGTEFGVSGGHVHACTQKDVVIPLWTGLIAVEGFIRCPSEGRDISVSCVCMQLFITPLSWAARIESDSFGTVRACLACLPDFFMNSTSNLNVCP